MSAIRRISMSDGVTNDSSAEYRTQIAQLKAKLDICQRALQNIVEFGPDTYRVDAGMPRSTMHYVRAIEAMHATAEAALDELGDN